MAVESVQQIFCRVADQWPSRTAISAGVRQASYAELDRLSDDRAGFLAGAGAARGTMAALLIDDPVEMVIALLACLKAGCVFVPIDPRLPPARIEAMLAVARPAWLLAESSLLPLLERLAPAALAGVAVARVDGAEAGGHHAERRVLCPADPDQMCYVYFTSGSTGQPKGIAGRLKAIDHFVRWEIDTFVVTPETRVSHLTSPAFDASLRDVFVPLCAGGTICVPASRETILDTPRLLRWLEEERVQVLHCVPSLFRALLNAGRAPLGLPDLRHVLLAGEPLLPADVGRWLDLYGERTRLVNLYGPTETTMTKFAYLVQPGDRGRRRIPIGTPIRGARALVVDGRGAVCVPGQAGEIWIRTPFRTLGYLGQPELTREVFIPNPFGDGAADDVVYKTGDLGRVLDDGNFEFLGRMDQQVKIRGVRVELAEIESHLRAHAAVEDVAVIDRDGQDGGNKVLCAYVVTREPVPAELLQQHLAARLPEQAVPSLFVELAELPRTVTGKVDRRALPAPSRVARQAAAPPRNAVEELVAGAWEQVLHASGFGSAESFFTVGGDSLLFVQVLARIRQLFRVEMPLRAFFEAPTIAGLAQAVETALRRGQGPAAAPVAPQEPLAPLPPIGPIGPIGRRAREGPSALSFAQERL
ncbi:MAG TPA: non-ribosomal peptide synthetase, partial [Thermoanaerobaculia bacterium]